MFFEVRNAKQLVSNSKNRPRGGCADSDEALILRTEMMEKGM
jgi:hypothetical protein